MCLWVINSLSILKGNTLTLPIFKSSDIGEKRAADFLEEIQKNGAVFYLKHPNEEDGILVCESNLFFYCDVHSDNSCSCEEVQSMEVIPVWSKKYEAYARSYAKNLNLVEIDLDEFITLMLPWMIKSKILLGVNWDHQGFGGERTAAEIYNALNKESC